MRTYLTNDKQIKNRNGSHTYSSGTSDLFSALTMFFG